jgi:hypothetical protein
MRLCPTLLEANVRQVHAIFRFLYAQFYIILFCAVLPKIKDGSGETSLEVVSAPGSTSLPIPLKETWRAPKGQYGAQGAELTAFAETYGPKVRHQIEALQS